MYYFSGYFSWFCVDNVLAVTDKMRKKLRV
jgi:hypothetical protein